MAYYTVPTTNIEESIDFYEDTVTVFKKKQVPDEMQAILGNTKIKSKKNSTRLLDPNHNKGHFNQFRLVDAEEFVIGKYFL